MEGQMKINSTDKILLEWEYQKECNKMYNVSYQNYLEYKYMELRRKHDSLLKDLSKQAATPPEKQITNPNEQASRIYQ